jgi:hypothetical protein
MRKRGEQVPTALRESLSHEETDLAEKFSSWLSPKWRRLAYGDSVSKRSGCRWGVYDGAPVENCVEFDPPEPQRSGIGLDNVQDVMQLGMNFSGAKNYLAALQPDILLKKILPLSLADNFWVPARDAQEEADAKLREELTRKLRRAWLTQKLMPARIGGRLVATKHQGRHAWP